MGSWLALLLWCGYWWPRSVATALAGAALIAGGAGLQLGTQMLMMRRVLRRRGVPLPSAMVALRAWLSEWRWAWRLFGWQIPFGEHAEPDGVSVEGKQVQGPVQGQVGVVLVHGYFCNRGVWTVWLRRLKSRGIAGMAMTLEPAHGSSVNAMVDDLDRCVKAMVQQTGCAPLLVAHSMGGLVVRAWLKRLDAGERARHAAHVVTVATPHGGAWLARFAQRLPAVEMREGSDWLQRLGPPPEDVPFSCWCSSSDNIVFPPIWLSCRMRSAIRSTMQRICSCCLMRGSGSTVCSCRRNCKSDCRSDRSSGIRRQTEVPRQPMPGHGPAGPEPGGCRWQRPGRSSARHSAAAGRTAGRCACCRHCASSRHGRSW